MRVRSAWRFVALLLIVIFPLLISGCGNNQKVAEESVMESQSEKPTPEPAVSIVRTRDDPGAYAGKEDGHIPRITWEKSEPGFRVTVTVAHEMNPDTPHYIMWIGLWDDAGNPLGEQSFTAQDETAEAVFDLERLPSGFKAYEKCNLHGIWLGEMRIDIP
jgi:desulfoferrodoxin (superoxide reductase-like protein)